MFKNYFKIAWRNLLKNKTTSFINIGGLSVGLAVAIIIMLWVTDEYSTDKFHKQLPYIYSVMQNEKQEGEIATFQSQPGPLAAALRTAIPEIKYASRVSYPSEQLIKSGEKSLYETGIYAEPEYFNIMSFPALEGNAVTALQDPGSVVITETTAKKIFGNEDAMGKLITHNNIHNLKVGAVLKDIPVNSNLKFDMVLPFSIYEKENSDWINRWDNNSILTWVELNTTANAAAVNKKMTALFRNKSGSTTGEIFAYPLSELAMHGKFKNGKPDGGRIEMLTMLGVLGTFVLLIACINFMNLSTARSERRAREVGVRKSLGASKKNLVFQFLSEAFLMTLFALAAGIILAKILLPGFNNWTGKNVSFNMLNPGTWLLLGIIGFITGLLSGSYPAFFLSRFQPVKVLKGSIAVGRGSSLFRKGLVTFQFVISIFLIIVTIVVSRQVRYAEQRPIGYEQHNLIEIPARGDMIDKFDLVKTGLLQLPGVQSVSAGSDDLISFNGSTNGIEWPGKLKDQDFPIAVTRVQYEWTKTTGLKILQGRDFSPEYGSDTLSCLINEAAVKKMGLKEPVVGTMLDKNKIIGVLADFMYNDPYTAARPLLAFLDKKNTSHFFVRLQDGEKWQNKMGEIEAVVKRSNPNYPFEFHLTEEAYDRKFIGLRSGAEFSSVVGILAIIISCLGLFALSAFVAERRTKEIGIRKVLGASAKSIWVSLSKDFLKPVVLAFILASPLAAFAMQKMLLVMEYHIQLSWWMFAIAGLAAVIIAIITVSFQGVKAAIANPVKSLRTE
ncbi:MAG: ABC transporter permease [Ferruginibacter sp.]